MATLQDDLRRLKHLRDTADELRSQADDAKEAYERLHAEVFVRMEIEETPAITVGDTNFVRAETQYGQVQDLSAFIEWCEVNRPELLELKPRKALVNEIVRESLDTNQPLPDGLGFYVKQYISQRVSR